MTSESAGPYLAAAVFCEKVLREVDGTLSLIRIVDRLIFTQVGPPTGERPPSAMVNLMAVVSFKSGAARGGATVTLQPEAPSGLRLPAVNLPVLFEGEDRGVNLVTAVQFVADQEGLYWFNVMLDGKQITRIPLRVMYQRVSVGGPPGP